LVGTDLVTGATRTASASAFKCAGRTVDFQVRGRWALLVCYDPYPSYGWAVTAMAVDLGGQYPAWNIPLGELGQIPALGAGFVAWQSVDPVTGRRALMVADLAPEHETHTYGPMSWVWRVGVDDADVARLVYLDEQEQPRALEIPWLHPLAPGEVRPALQGAAVRAATGTTTELTVSWQGPWADGPLRYDVRWSSDGTWVQPLEWQALDANSVTLSVGPDTQTCFSVRARSDTGTPGPWSTATCGKVDGSAPVVAFTSTARVLLDNRADVPIAYIAKDSVSGVASYDGQYRIAHPGQAYGSWVAPAAWQRSTASTQVLHLGPGDAGCVNVRAADVVGHTSGWVSRCLTRPIDDRQLTIDGKVVRSKSGLAYAGTYTRLSAKGASASLANQTGHQIALVVLRGPSQGTVHVYIGKHRVGRVHLTARTLQRALVWLPREASTWRGTVRLVSVSSAPARIDGIVIAR
jgi:hypothetical protein